LPSLAAREGTGILAASSALSRDAIVCVRRRLTRGSATSRSIAFDRFARTRRSSFANDVSAPMIAMWR
jgi:hypothetical protein